MRYIRTFEEVNQDNQDVKNKIFLIDTSGSFAPILEKSIDKINFYLADKFTTILCSYRVDDVLNDISLDSLISMIHQRYFYAGGGDLQEGIDYIIKNKLQGDVLLFTDGMIEIDVTNLPNNIAILSTEFKPKVVGDALIFMHDLESLENFYKPRDITPEQYELKKAAQKYNL